MGDGPAHASWHPALMPDSLPVAVHPEPAKPEIAGRTSSDQVRQSPAATTESRDEALPDSAPEGTLDPWLTEETGDDDGDAWLVQGVSDAVTSSDPQAAEGSLHEAEDLLDETLTDQTRQTSTEIEPRHGADPTDADFSHLASGEPHEAARSNESRTTIKAQHSSSMSFARTVSHEVNFYDDDGDEWNLSRTEPDVADSTARADVSDPFEVTSPSAAASFEESNHPLPATQALDIMEEVERHTGGDQSYGKRDQSGANLAASPDLHARQGASQVMTGDTPGTEAQDFEARFEEGVPLMSTNDDPSHDPAQSSTSAFVDSFTDDTANDDFFNQMPQPNSQVASIEAFDRKTTPQVAGSAIEVSPSRRSSPEEVITGKQGSVEPTNAWAQDENWDISQPSDLAANGIINEQSADELASKWQAAFAGDDDDDDFLLDDSHAEDKELDPAAFLGSDDEGFLDDDIGADPTPAASSTRPSNPYAPVNAGTGPSSTPYMPTANTALPPQSGQPMLPSLHSAPQLNHVAQVRPDQSRALSFADKSKGGYSSPYDLPTDLLSNTLKPRKRTSTQQLPHEHAPPPPPRSTSMFAQGLPPVSGHPAQGPSLERKASAPPSRNSTNFFEDLPITTKPKPASRPSSRQGSAQHPDPYAPPHQYQQPAPPLQGPLSPPPSRGSQPVGVADLVAPERASPYAALQSSSTPSLPPPSGVTSRYSPAPMQQQHHQGSTPPAAMARYSPAPPGARPSSSHSSSGPITPSQTVLPHLPRTSSPLAHFESSSEKLYRAVHTSNGDAHYSDRRSNEPRLNRVASLPPTREVDEEQDDGQVSSAYKPFSPTQPGRPVESRYAPGPSTTSARQTPPPASRSYAPPTVTSPHRATSTFMPHSSAPALQPGFVPPPRASTQSPNAVQGGAQARPADYSVRPSSAQAPSSPTLPRAAHPVQTHRRRGPSLSMTMVPPTDGREHDPLQRWRGAPVLAWSVGGTLVTSFPRSVPRYTISQTTPTVMRTCGEVKVRNIKDVDPLTDRLAKFPGPLKGKSKKKEALAWLAAGIDTLEKDLPDISFHSQLSLEAKRGVERLLLWKLLRVFIEYDGVLEGSPAVETAVRQVLSPETAAASTDGSVPPPALAVAGAQTGAVTSMMADSADPAAVEQIRLDLIKGNRETAVWSAVDKRLWGHAMLISHTVSPDLYKQVAQEFVRKEVNYPGHSNESIAALYKVLSGNFDDCVDELVPIHARVGLQLVTQESAQEPRKDAVDGLDKWQETLTLILNNRSNDDVRGLKALGKLLSSYGRAEAAQICFIFSRSISIFGGLDDQNADFVLLGSDHRQQSDQFAKETEALQLSEVYEYGLSLAGGTAAAAGAPHLAAYKLQHAVTLAEYGYRDKALQYCDAIAAAMVSQTRRSPYHHAILETAVDDFMIRLKQAPKDASSSWMSKPSMNKVSDSMWNRFNKFVSGDDGENAGHGGNGEAENGPFARVATTPNLSRSPSTSNFEVYGATSPNFVANSGNTFAPSTSRYAPGPAQPASVGNPYMPMSQHPPAPVSSGRSSNEHPRNPYEPAQAGIGSPPGLVSPTSFNSGGYAPSGIHASGFGYQPVQPDPSQNASTTYNHVAPQNDSTPNLYQPLGLANPPTDVPSSNDKMANGHAATQNYQPLSFGYEPPQSTVSAINDQEGGQQDSSTGGYEPPSYQPYSYEPPSYQPDPEQTTEDGDEAPKPKKKSFMDDDDDDAVPARSAEKSKAEKDRENQEMFRKAAEEDAKRAAAQQATKKGWGFSGWFGGGGKKGEAGIGEPTPGKPIKAKLGEASSFVYDPELKRWINKKPGAENVEIKKGTPPPPRAAPRSVSGTPPPASSSTPPPMGGRMSAPPPSGPPRPASRLVAQPSQENLGGEAVMAAPGAGPAPSMSRSTSNSGLAPAGPPSGPPSRPATSMSNASSIDDLLGPPAPRKAGQKKPRKSGRYVDVMAK